MSTFEAEVEAHLDRMEALWAARIASLDLSQPQPCLRLVEPLVEPETGT